MHKKWGDKVSSIESLSEFTVVYVLEFCYQDNSLGHEPLMSIGLLTSDTYTT